MIIHFWKTLLTLLSLVSCQTKVVKSKLPSVQTDLLQLRLGSSQYLNPNKHLVIPDLPDSVCEVTVLESKRSFRTALAPGKLYPDSFACDFGDKEVVYKNFGTNKPHRLFLQIRWDTKNTTSIQRVNLNIETTGQQKYIQQSTPFPEISKSGSLTIDSSILDIQELENPSCELKFIETDFLPRSGILENANFDEFVNCKQALNANVRYLHKSESAINRDEILVNIKSDSFDEHILLIVYIKDLPPNRPPFLESNLNSIITVYGPIITPITYETLSTRDLETPGKEDVLYNIDEPIYQTAETGHFATVIDPTYTFGWTVK